MVVVKKVIVLGYLVKLVGLPSGFAITVVAYEGDSGGVQVDFDIDRSY